jgi:hypothetical protein
MKAIILASVVLVMWVVGLCVAAGRPLPRPPRRSRNRRGRRLARLMKVNGVLR